MKKKAWIIAITAFLVCINAVYAATQVGSGWYFSGETIKVENRAYTLLMTTSLVTADYGTGFININNNTCNIADHVRFCVDNIEYNHQTDLIRADMDIYTLKPKITLSRTASDTEFFVSQETKVTVTITNSGDARALNVKYIDDFPSEFEITDYEDSVKEGNSIKWEGTIGASKSESFNYRLKAKDKIKAGFKGKLVYYDGFETQTTYTDVLEFTANPFLTLIPAIGKTTIATGETVNYSLNISNAYPGGKKGRLNVDTLELILDKDLEIIDTSAVLKKVNDTVYHWSGYVGNNNSLTIYTNIRGTLVPGGTIYAKAYYTDPEGVSRETDQYKTRLLVEEKGVYIKSNIEDATLEAYEKKRVKVWLQNKNPTTLLKDVIVNVSGEFAYFPNLYYKSLPSHQTNTIVDKVIYGPPVSSATNYKLKVNASYKTEFGDNGSTTYTTTLSVNPIKELEVSHVISAAEIRSGETTTVTTKVKNKRSTKVNNVYIKDTFSEDLKTTGLTSKKMQINKDTTITAYTYIITGPPVKNSTMYPINATAYYYDELINDTYKETILREYSILSYLTVKPQELSLSITKTISGTTLYKGEIIDVDYLIENPSSDKTAYDITLQFPLSQDFDLVGEKTTFYVGSLAPGEKIYAYSKEKIRSKYNTTSTKIPKTRATYFNKDGASFDSNSSEPTKDFLAGTTEGPYVIAEVNSSDEINNTNDFEVKVTIRNTGTSDAKVTATDDIRNWTAVLSPASEKTFSYRKTYSKAGTYDLPQVRAYYSYKTNSFITGSNIERVTVKEKPLIEIKKSVEGETNNMDNFTVVLNVKNLEGKKLENITVTDEGNEWKLETLEKEKEFSYGKRISQLGSATLTATNATYWNNGYEYKTSSNSLQVEIVKKEVIKAEKQSKEDINQSMPFTINITISNIDEKPLKNVVVSDEEKEWTIDLEPKEQKTLQYQKTFEDVEEKTLPAATIKYTYNNEEYEIKTNTKKIRVREYTPPQIKLDKKPEELLAKIFWYAKKILTWRRS